ncbi:unnamed protein product [Peronospora belbahrii]|uniref:Amino acid permease/ SLC12A domain-containing protein n=1 Tax=Peronospora belbahrii TaxID=622444 RepID=A0AAU9KPZ4_9STRA|nr:unnamed protein product [Peronospora belbahrii]
MNQLLDLSSDYGLIWWAVSYVVFVSLNIVRIETTFCVQAFTTVVSVLILVVFYIGAATKLSYTEWVSDVDWDYPRGWDGAVKGDSFALWFYLAIEELPLAVEVTINPKRANEIDNSSSPLLAGYKSVFGDNRTTLGFSWVLVLGLIASFHSFVFCMGQLLYAIARDALLDFPLFLVLHYIIGDTRLGSVLINLALIGAVISYSFQLTSLIRMRIKEPNRARPDCSPFGIPGAMVPMILCVVGMVSIIYSGTSSYEFLASIIVAILYFSIGAVYFFMRVRPRIQAAPTPNLREYMLSNESSKTQ